MKGFIQWLDKPAGILRTGEGTEKMWDDWEDRVVVTVEEDGYVMFHAFRGYVDRKLVEALVSTANADTGLPVKWLQKVENSDPILVQQISGVDGKGRIIMKTLHEEVIAQSGGAKAAHPSQGGGLQVGESRVLPAQSSELSATIVEAYAAKIRAGEHKLSGITETYFGGGKFMRSFVIDETPN